MDNFREVSNCDKSTGLEYFSNDSSVKKRHYMEISPKKISHMRFSIETQFKIEFLPRFIGGKKCLEFPLLIICSFSFILSILFHFVPTYRNINV